MTKGGKVEVTSQGIHTAQKERAEEVEKRFFIPTFVGFKLSGARMTVFRAGK
jgi:hypothetical protein